MKDFSKKAIMKVSEAGLLVMAVSSTALARNHNTGIEDGIEGGAQSAKPTDAPENLFSGPDGIFRNITNTLIFLVGAIAVVMLIIGGLRYVLSGGNSSNVESAKNTIFYAIIGIVVAILAFAIVNFVIGGVSDSTSMLLLG